MMLQALMKQAIEKNTNDNITAAIAFYGITPQHPVVINAGELTALPETEDLLFEPLAGEMTEGESVEFTETSADESDQPVETDPEEIEDEQDSGSLTLIVVGLIALIIVTVALALGLDWLVRRNQAPQQPSTPGIEQPVETDNN